MKTLKLIRKRIKLFIKSFWLGWKDERTYKFFWKKVTTGISPKELWNLDWYLAEHIEARLRVFREHVAGRPGCFATEKEWHETLDKMIVAFEIAKKDIPNKQEAKKLREGFRLFGLYFRGLWY